MPAGARIRRDRPYDKVAYLIGFAQDPLHTQGVLYGCVELSASSRVADPAPVSRQSARVLLGLEQGLPESARIEMPDTTNMTIAPRGRETLFERPP